MRVREFVEMLMNCPPDFEVIVGSQSADRNKYFVWRKEPRVVEPGEKLLTPIAAAIYIQGIGEVLEFEKIRRMDGPEVLIRGGGGDGGFLGRMPPQRFVVAHGVNPIGMPGEPQMLDEEAMPVPPPDEIEDEVFIPDDDFEEEEDN